MPVYKTNKTKDGKTQYKVVVCYKDAQGKYKQKSRFVYGAAEAKLEELYLQKEISESVPDSKMTVQALYDEYILSKRNDVRATTLQKTSSILERDIIPYLGKIHLDSLSVSQLQKWKNIIAEKDIKTVTKNNSLRELRSMLNYAVRMEYINRNPLAALGNFRDVTFEGVSDKLHYYTSEQFKQYIAFAKSSCRSLSDYGYYIFFCIAFFTGMRKGEINALRWSDIEGNVIHVRRSIAQKLRGEDVETPPKNKSSYRDLQIPHNLSVILDEHKRRQQQLENFSESFRVCGGIAVLRDTSIENRNKRFAADAGLPHIRIHDFRHSHVSLLCNEGINIQEIARRIGHSNITITWNTYSHLYPREEERALKVLEKITMDFTQE